MAGRRFMTGDYVVYLDNYVQYSLGLIFKLVGEIQKGFFDVYITPVEKRAARWKKIER
jgi:hypothetical protein